MGFLGPERWLAGRQWQRPASRTGTRRSLGAERLEARHLMAGSIEPVTLESIAQRICDPESDTNHAVFRDAIEATNLTRHFSIVAYDTGHPAGSTFDKGALFGQGECAVVPAEPTDPETPLTVFRSLEKALSIEAVDVPANEVDQMELVIDGGEVMLTDRIALARHVAVTDGIPDVRQFAVISSDTYIRLNTLPNSIVDGLLLDDNFGLSVNFGPSVAEVRSTGEVRRLGQIQRMTIDTRQGLPSIHVTFPDGGTAILDFSEVTTERTRVDVTANYAGEERLVVIGSNPLTQDMRQRADVISDFNSVLIETVGPAGQLFVGPAWELGNSLSKVESVARVAFLQDVKSEHNPRDASIVILLGEGIPSDGFGDITLVEAEDGIHPAEPKIIRETASHHGDIRTVAETSVFLENAQLSGTISGVREGSNVSFVRHSLDDPNDSVATLTLHGAIVETLTLESTQLPGLATAEAWNFHKTAYGSEFQANTSSLAYTLSAARGEIDALGVIHVGGEIGLNRFDVNASGDVTAGDALLVVNFMRRNGGPVELAPLGSRLNVTQPVLSDTRISALDALQVINFLSRLKAEASGESTSVLFVAPADASEKTEKVLRDLEPVVSTLPPGTRNATLVPDENQARVVRDLAILSFIHETDDETEDARLIADQMIRAQQLVTTGNDDG